MIRVVCVGRTRGPLAEASAEYEERLARACKFDLQELREEGAPSLAPREAMLRERARIEPLIAGYWVVALDRSGVQRSSKQIAELVREREERAPQRTAFVLGGPHGIDETLAGRGRPDVEPRQGHAAASAGTRRRARAAVPSVHDLAR